MSKPVPPLSSPKPDSLPLLVGLFPLTLSTIVDVAGHAVHAPELRAVCHLSSRPSSSQCARHKPYLFSYTDHIPAAVDDLVRGSSAFEAKWGADRLPASKGHATLDKHVSNRWREQGAFDPLQLGVASFSPADLFGASSSMNQPAQLGTRCSHARKAALTELQNCRRPPDSYGCFRRRRASLGCNVSSARLIC